MVYLRRMYYVARIYQLVSSLFVPIRLVQKQYFEFLEVPPVLQFNSKITISSFYRIPTYRELAAPDPISETQNGDQLGCYCWAPPLSAGAPPSFAAAPPISTATPPCIQRTR
jgi:hypothetical protein